MILKLASGYLVKVFSVVSTFIFIPLYLKYLGLENYSIISLGLIVSGILNILDSGLTSTMIRELSRQDTSYERKQDTFKALEMVYFGIVIALNLLVYLTADYIASNFVNSSQIPKESILIALTLIGVEASCQMLMRFYIGGLIGLERQITANIIQIAWSIFRNGLVIVVIVINPKISSFFLWQVICAVLCAIISRYILGISLGVQLNIIMPAHRVKEILKAIWPFASGLLTISVVAALSTQVDKIVIAKLLEIEILGYYTLAISFAGGLTALVSPVSNVLLPRMTSLFSSQSIVDAVVLYKRFCLIISVTTFSISSNIFFLSHDIMLAWTGSEEVARNVRVYLAIASLSYSMLAMAVMPYVVALANGHTRTNTIIGVTSLILTLPGYYFSIQHYGGVGAATVFFIQQTTTTIIFTIYIAKKFMGINYWSSLVAPIILPMVATFAIAWLIKDFNPLNFNGRFSHFIKIIVSILGTLSIPTAIILTKLYLQKRRLDKLNTSRLV
jgi:O-antigen/teichoic acid export membrane protein